MLFKVTFEASGLTNSKELVGQECSGYEAQGFTEVALAESAFPKNVLAVLGGHITDDDNQGATDIHVFVCVDLLLEVDSENAAKRMVPPFDILNKISDLMSGSMDLHLEANSWEVTQVEGSQDDILLALQQVHIGLEMMTNGGYRMVSSYEGRRDWICVIQQVSNGRWRVEPNDTTEAFMYDRFSEALALATSFIPKNSESVGSENCESTTEDFPIPF